MLILSAEYVREHGGNPRNLGLYGQEDNGGVWSICKMNMLLHGIPDADLRNDDTLAEPLHLEGGELMRFDRVITNPPFSQNYAADGIPFPERFRYGFCPESGKKADLMFVQHMLSVLRPDGAWSAPSCPTACCSGRAEKEIRTGFIEDDLLDAVIGLAPNLFYGTGIPACILVLRAKGAKPAERQGKVLFINADREYYEGRARTTCSPSTSRRSSAPTSASPTSRASPPWCPTTSWPRTTTTSTSAATPTTPRRPSPTTCAPTSSAACRRRRSRPRPSCSMPTASTPCTCWSSGTSATSTSAAELNEQRRPQAAHRGRPRSPGQGADPRRRLRGLVERAGAPHRRSCPRPRS